MSIKKKRASNLHSEKIIQFDEISPPTVKNVDVKYDPVVEIRNQLFLLEEKEEYKHCGLARRESGSIEFLWNFRIVESNSEDDALLGGFVDMIDCDFGNMYYRKVFLDLVTDIENLNGKTANKK